MCRFQIDDPGDDPSPYLDRVRVAWWFERFPNIASSSGRRGGASDPGSPNVIDRMDFEVQGPSIQDLKASRRNAEASNCAKPVSRGRFPIDRVGTKGWLRENGARRVETLMWGFGIPAPRRRGTEMSKKRSIIDEQFAHLTSRKSPKG